MQKIVIDLAELFVAEDKAQEFALSIVGEPHLVTLWQAKKQIDELWRSALDKLAEQAFEYHKDVKLIDGERVRVSFSRSGKRYVADNLEDINPEFVKVVRGLDSDRIYDYLKRHEKLPRGIKIVDDSERPISIRVKVKDE